MALLCLTAVNMSQPGVTVTSHSHQRSQRASASQLAATGLALNGLHPNRDFVSLQKYIYGSPQNPGKQAETLQAHKDVHMDEETFVDKLSKYSSILDTVSIILL